MAEEEDLSVQYLALEDRGADRRAGKSAGGNSRGSRRGGKGGGRGGESREVAISKALSKLLRHAAAEAGLALDGEGFGRLDEVVSFLIYFCIWFHFLPLYIGRICVLVFSTTNGPSRNRIVTLFHINFYTQLLILSTDEMAAFKIPKCDGRRNQGSSCR